MRAAAAVGRVASESPLTPSPEEADSLLRRELLRPEYRDETLMQQFVRWLGRQIEAGLDKASSAPPLGAFGAIVLFLVVLVLLGWLLSRARQTAQAAHGPGSVLTPERVTAAELRVRAEAALERGDAAGALVDGFRALTLHQIELGVLEEQPGATAHEVAISLGATYPERAGALRAAAELFDLVLYGDRPALAEQARTVLALGDDLVGVR